MGDERQVARALQNLAVAVGEFIRQRFGVASSNKHVFRTDQDGRRASYFPNSTGNVITFEHRQPLRHDDLVRRPAVFQDGLELIFQGFPTPAKDSEKPAYDGTGFLQRQSAEDRFRNIDEHPWSKSTRSALDD